MHRSIPKAAQMILLAIYQIETGRPPPACYETIYGHKESELPKPLTTMTLDEVEAAQPSWTKQYGSSAAGAAQFMRNTLDAPKTLRDIEGEMGLTGKERFSPDLQDRMAYHLLKRRGFLEFMAGKISVVKFGDRLAMEWASFPVLSVSLKGAHRTVKRGQTYYAGDGVNKVLTKPDFVENLLRSAKAAGYSNEAVVPEPSTEQYEEPAAPPAIPSAPPISHVAPKAPSWLSGAIIAAIAVLAGFLTWTYGQLSLEEAQNFGQITPLFGDGAGATSNAGGSILMSLALPILLSFVQPLIAAAAAWIVSQITYWWFRLLKVNFDQTSSERLHAALERAIYAGVETLGSKVSKTKLQAFAADYAQEYNSGDVKRFKLTTDDLKKLAVPHIGKIKLGG